MIGDHVGRTLTISATLAIDEYVPICLAFDYVEYIASVTVTVTVTV